MYIIILVLCLYCILSRVSKLNTTSFISINMAENTPSRFMSYFIQAFIRSRAVIRLQIKMSLCCVITDHISLSFQVFGDYYHFRHRTVVKRSLSDHRGTQVRLERDPKVRRLFQELRALDCEFRDVDQV